MLNLKKVTKTEKKNKNAMRICHAIKDHQTSCYYKGALSIKGFAYQKERKTFKTCKSKFKKKKMEKAKTIKIINMRIMRKNTRDSNENDTIEENDSESYQHLQGLIARS